MSQKNGRGTQKKGQAPNKRTSKPTVTLDDMLKAKPNIKNPEPTAAEVKQVITPELGDAQKSQTENAQTNLSDSENKNLQTNVSETNTGNIQTNVSESNAANIQTNIPESSTGTDTVLETNSADSQTADVQLDVRESTTENVQSSVQDCQAENIKVTETGKCDKMATSDQKTEQTSFKNNEILTGDQKELTHSEQLPTQKEDVTKLTKTGNKSTEVASTINSADGDKSFENSSFDSSGSAVTSPSNNEVGVLQRNFSCDSKCTEDLDSEVSNILKDSELALVADEFSYDDEEDYEPISTHPTEIIMKKTFTESSVPDREFVPIPGECCSMTVGIESRTSDVASSKVVDLESGPSAVRHRRRTRPVEDWTEDVVAESSTSEERKTVIESARSQAQELYSGFRHLQDLLEHLYSFGECLDAVDDLQEPQLEFKSEETLPMTTTGDRTQTGREVSHESVTDADVEKASAEYADTTASQTSGDSNQTTAEKATMETPSNNLSVAKILAGIPVDNQKMADQKLAEKTTVVDEILVEQLKEKTVNEVFEEKTVKVSMVEQVTLENSRDKETVEEISMKDTTVNNTPIEEASVEKTSVDKPQLEPRLSEETAVNQNVVDQNPTDHTGNSTILEPSKLEITVETNAKVEEVPVVEQLLNQPLSGEKPNGKTMVEVGLQQENKTPIDSTPAPQALTHKTSMSAPKAMEKKLINQKPGELKTGKQAPGKQNPPNKKR